MHDTKRFPGYGGDLPKGELTPPTSDPTGTLEIPTPWKTMEFNNPEPSVTMTKHKTPNCFFALLCVALLLCIALLWLALPCFALHCFALHCFALLCTAWLCFALPCFALHCSELLRIVLLWIALHCFALLWQTIRTLQGKPNFGISRNIHPVQNACYECMYINHENI